MGCGRPGGAARLPRRSLSRGRAARGLGGGGGSVAVLLDDVGPPAGVAAVRAGGARPCAAPP